jgi:hypothetical protein
MFLATPFFYSHSYPMRFALSLSHFLSLDHAHLLSISLSLILSFSLSVTLSLSLSLSLTHAHRYTPFAHFNGLDSITYNVTDQLDPVSWASNLTNVVVIAANDAPTLAFANASYDTRAFQVSQARAVCVRGSQSAVNDDRHSVSNLAQYSMQIDKA